MTNDFFTLGCRLQMMTIFCLQSEKVKQLLTSGRYRPLTLNEPTAALHRDNFAAVNTKVDEAQICSLAEHQLSSLESLVLQQRRAQIRIARVLKDAELRHRKVSFLHIANWFPFQFILIYFLRASGLYF